MTTETAERDTSRSARDAVAENTSEGRREPSREQVILAGAKLTRFLRYKERVAVTVEPNSVYGAAVLMPQLAATTGWSRDFASMAISSWIYLIVCMILHAALLKYVSKEERVMDGFAGQPYLCDVGAFLQTTAQLGPGGTEMSAPRLYSWGQWVTRCFVRDALVGTFPDQEKDIKVFADPGEYGIESYTCRLFCVVIFIISIVPECMLCVSMAKMFYYLPTKSEPWIKLRTVEDIGDEVIGGGAEDCNKKVTVCVAGMSAGWKLVNLIFILIPKCLLVYFTAHSGVNFLMETAGIDDIIVNSVALGFLLTMDELIARNLMSAAANELLDSCEGFIVSEEDDNKTFDDEEMVKRFHQPFAHHWISFCYSFLFQLRQLASVGVITAIFLGIYYRIHCVPDEDGRWVSKPIFTPKSLDFNVLNAFSPLLFPINRDAKPYWTMPEK